MLTVLNAMLAAYASEDVLERAGIVGPIANCTPLLVNIVRIRHSCDQVAQDLRGSPAS